MMLRVVLRVTESEKTLVFPLGGYLEAVMMLQIKILLIFIVRIMRVPVRVNRSKLYLSKTFTR